MSEKSIDQMMGQIELLLPDASPLPWATFDGEAPEDHEGPYPKWRGVVNAGGEPVVERCGGDGYADSILNADLIVAAVNAAPHLIEAIGTLRRVAKAAEQEHEAALAQLEQVTQQRDEWSRQCNMASEAQVDAASIAAPVEATLRECPTCPLPMTLEALMAMERDHRLPTCETVGELVAALRQLPPDLRLVDPTKPLMANQKHSPVLLLEEDDGTWDDGDDEEVARG